VILPVLRVAVPALAPPMTSAVATNSLEGEEQMKHARDMEIEEDEEDLSSHTAPRSTVRSLQDTVRSCALSEVRERLRNDHLGDTDEDGELLMGLLFTAAQRRSTDAVEVCRLIVEDHGLGTAGIQDAKMHQTALFYAARYSTSGVAEYLVDHDADVDHNDGLSQTPLFYAARYGNVGCARLLLARRADVDKRDSIGQTPIFYATRYSTVDSLIALVDARADVNAVDSKSRQTPLFYAADGGHFGNAQLLLERRADVDAEDRSKQTPLFFAVRQGRVEICRALVKVFSANPVHVDMHGQKPVDFASKAPAKQRELVTLFHELASGRPLGPRRGPTPETETPRKLKRRRSGVGPIATPDCGDLDLLSVAVLNGSASEVRDLISAGHDPKIVDTRSGLNLVFLAAMRPPGRGSEARAICVLLVGECGVCVTHLDSEDQTALFYAVRQGHVDCAAYLIQARCDPGHVDCKGRTPLLQAAALESTACCSLLVAQLADVNVLDADGQSPLVVAAAAGRTETIELLLGSGAHVDHSNRTRELCLSAAATAHVARLVDALCDPNLQDDSGRSPAFMAAACGDKAKVAALLKARGDVNLCNVVGQTVLHCAVQHRQLEIAGMLVEMHGADLDRQDNSGMSAIDRSTQLDWHEGVSLLETLKRRLGQRKDHQRWVEVEQAVRVGSVDEVRAAVQAAGGIEFVRSRDARGGARSSEVPLLLRSTHSAAPTKCVTATKLKCKGCRMKSQRTKGVRERHSYICGECRLAPQSTSVLLSLAAARDHGDGALAICQYLVEEVGITPGAFSPDLARVTATMNATAKGHVDICDYLLRQKANVDATDAEGRTALFFGCDSGCLEAVSALLNARADVEILNGRAETALFTATRKSRACAKLLLGVRASIDCVDMDGQGPLFHAAMAGADGTVRLLADARANVNALDGHRLNALWYAVRDSREQIAMLLLDELGADVPQLPATQDAFGNIDILEMARARGLTEVRSKLTAAHAKQIISRQ